MIAVLIPDRGDRPEFTSHAFWQLDRQTVQPDQVIHVDDPPMTPGYDLSERLQKGLQRCECDSVVIWENDDYYPDNYLEEVSMGLEVGDLVGFDFTIYYHIKFLKYIYLHHFTPPRASLAFTAFRMEAIKGFQFPRNQNPLVDMQLWAWANSKNIKRFLFKPEYCEQTGFIPVSIKHGKGLCGVRWHHKMMDEADDDTGMVWLRDHTRTESFEFYQQWHILNR